MRKGYLTKTELQDMASEASGTVKKLLEHIKLVEDNTVGYWNDGCEHYKINKEQQSEIHEWEKGCARQRQHVDTPTIRIVEFYVDTGGYGITVKCNCGCGRTFEPTVNY